MFWKRGSRLQTLLLLLSLFTAFDTLGSHSSLKSQPEHSQNIVFLHSCGTDIGPKRNPLLPTTPFLASDRLRSEGGIHCAASVVKHFTILSVSSLAAGAAGKTTPFTSLRLAFCRDT